MKHGKIAIPVIILLLFTTVASGQNWMMAQKYMNNAIDSVIKIKWPNTGIRAGVDITDLEYDDLLEEYTIDFTDTVIYSKLDIIIRKKEDADTIIETGELIVSLKGGESNYSDEDGDITGVELADLSEYVFIYNETGKEVAFSLSNDNKKFEEYNLKPNQYLYYSCSPSDFGYFMVSKASSWKDSGNVHYKVSKSKGYRVKFDAVKAKFEILPDERMKLEDFIN